ncbi:MAG: alpha-L-rhamnosidase [Lentisphaeria bacterium]|nr:alpha-L-rhamnosidase [Lentisphaeria bacterium]
MAVRLPAPVNTPEMAARAEFDERVRQYVRPCRVVWVSAAAGAAVEGAESLLEARTGQISTRPDRPCVLRNGSSGKAGVLLDFGRELHGGVQLLVWRCRNREGRSGVRVRVRCGESAMEAMSELGGPGNATNDHAVRDGMAEVGFFSVHETGVTGFRFVRLDLEGPDSWVELKSVRAIFTYRDLEYLGRFYSSEERLNRIWRTGAYTVHLNMQTFLWDGIKRDKLVWVGDMHPEVATILAVFGAHPVVPRSLDFARDDAPLPAWMNGISSYSIWWVLIQHAWHLHTGDLAYLRAQHAYLRGLLRQLAGLVDSEGREGLPEKRFLDWPSEGDDTAKHAGLQALLVLAFERGAALLHTLGDDESATRAEQMLALLRRQRPEPGSSKQAAALLALAGLHDARRLNESVMAVDGPRRMSTFYGYYVLQARALAGDFQGCLDCIRTYWGAMLDLGATTFWEDFDLDWIPGAAGIADLVPEGKKDIHGDCGNYCYRGFRHSLCHGWASGPTAWLSEHVLGIRPLVPGCSEVVVEPHLGDLRWVEGAYPTPSGVIRVRHERVGDGSVKTSLDVPGGVTVRRAPPRVP